MANAKEVIRTILRLVDSGRAKADVLEAMCEGIVLQTSRGTGVYKNGMLDINGALHGINIGGITSASVPAPAAPAAPAAPKAPPAPKLKPKPKPPATPKGLF